MLQIAIVGLGNVGRCVYDAVQSAPDMTTRIIIEPRGDIPGGLKDIHAPDISDIKKYGGIDAAIICAGSRLCPDIAEALLDMGISTADSYDIHTDIWEVKCRLDKAAKKSGRTSIISAGWDPGSDSVVRALFEAMTPRGLTYTNFGPGMSMGHSVAVKAIEGVENALSMTIPAGAGVHRRMVYVQLKPGASLGEVTQKINDDPYFSTDDTPHVIQVEDVTQYIDAGHGVHMTRKGVSGNTHNQILEFSMKINNPALTGQMLVSAARAASRQTPGCYTLIEIPVIDMLPGDKKDIIDRLV